MDNNKLHYKGFEGTINYSPFDKIYYGEVIFNDKHSKIRKRQIFERW